MGGLSEGLTKLKLREVLLGKGVVMHKKISHKLKTKKTKSCLLWQM